MKDSIKTSRLLESISKIVSATIKEEIKVVAWSSWDYEVKKWEKILTIDSNTLLTKRWKYTLAKVFINIWSAIFTDIPKDIVLRLKEDKEEHAFVLSFLEELRVINKMVFKYPGTRDLFQNAYKIDNKNITETTVSDLKSHRKLLFYIRQDFYGDTIDNILNKIDLVFRKFQKNAHSLYQADSLELMITNFETNLLEDYFSLYEKDDEEDKTDESLDDMIEGMQNEISEKEQQEEQKIVDEELGWLVDGEVEYKNEDPVWYTDLYNEFKHLIPRFVRKLNSILKDNNCNRNWGAYRSWVLNKRKLYKVVANDNKLFTRKLERRHKDYMVWLLLDCSWSMSWSKARLAAQSVGLMAEVLDKVWVKFEIVWFNQYYTEFKGVNDKYWNNSKLQIAESTWSLSWCGYNNDWYAVNRISKNMIVNSNENTERILIVLSDWMPAPSHGYWNYDLKSEVIKASKYSKVTWIGIQDSSVEKYYDKPIVIQNIKLLPEVLLNKLKHNIKRW